MAGLSHLLLTGNEVESRVHHSLAVNVKSNSHYGSQFTVQRSYAGQTLFISFQVLALMH